MSFDDKDFPGLYSADDDLDDEGDKSSRKKDSKKKDKRDKKDRGYKVFEGESSGEELVPDGAKSPISKLKKSKHSFRFAKRPDKLKAKEKEREKEKEKERGKEKEKEKERAKEKEKSKEGVGKLKLKGRKKRNIGGAIADLPDCLVFGIPLAVPVEQRGCHDGVPIPAIVRECIDYIEERGLSCEGIYRQPGTKSKVEALKKCYNKGLSPTLSDYDPNTVASLLKQYLREIPDPVIPAGLTNKLEDACTKKEGEKKVDAVIKILHELHKYNFTLLSWILVHMKHVIDRERENKMTLQNISIVLSPTLQISHRVLNVLFTNCATLFKDTIITRYTPLIKPGTATRWSMELPDGTEAIQRELAKQEAKLDMLHKEINAGKTSKEKEELLWEIQRIVTQLKRKLKIAKRVSDLKSSNAKEGDVAVGSASASGTPSKSPRSRHAKGRAPDPTKALAAVRRSLHTSQESGLNLEAANKPELNLNWCVDPGQITLGLEEGDATRASELGANVTEDVAAKAKVTFKSESSSVITADVHSTDVRNVDTSLGSQKQMAGEGNVPKIARDNDFPRNADKNGTTLEEKQVSADDRVNNVENGDATDITDEVLDLLAEQRYLLIEEEELKSIGQQLQRRIQLEKDDVLKLREEKAEIERSRLEFSSSESSSSTDFETTSSSNSEDEEELLKMLRIVMMENDSLEQKNTDLLNQIRIEREACTDIKVQIRIMQYHREQKGDYAFSPIKETVI